MWYLQLLFSLSIPLFIIIITKMVRLCKWCKQKCPVIFCREGVYIFVHKNVPLKSEQLILEQYTGK